MVSRFVLTLTIVAALTGCRHRVPPPAVVRVVETQRVDVPVYVRPEPPAELLAPLAAPIPSFVSPDDPAATSALTPDGETQLRQLIEHMLTRLRAWEAWTKGK